MNEGRLADRAYTNIVGIIREQKLVPGERLPSEARLAEMFGMSRGIVREALVRLASDGITEARRGAGSFVKRRPSERLAAHVPIDTIAATLGTYEVRFVLEAEAARLAAMRRSSEQMAEIDTALSRLAAALLSSNPAHDEDWQLHRAIALSTANAAFITTFDHMHDQVERILKAGVEISRSRPPEVIRAMLQEHEMIVDAIRVQDPDAAALAMRWHLSQGRKRLMPDGL
ncbi:FadR/GntR family transcriptional regulator [Phenylobacterium deserti]|uniref:GntR family transcriptional regulator n=1 Tax=Phenylobacterium deserti TaxID=1914756 RepID=A0A328ACC9_9CAUL|nr:FCD domain-containing protein [Phenylobacterium deserti]RAK52402.1 GntR family transcriptional regulator [Phenylobacterium deserti]